MSDSSLSSRQSAAQCVGPVHTTPDSLTTARDCSSSGQPADFGTTPADWQVVNAGEIGDFRGGNGFPIKYQGSEEGDYPFFKVSDLSGQKNSSVMVSAKYYITEEERASLGANLFPADAIVFAKIGAAIFLERKKLLAKNSCIDNNLAAFVLTDPSVDPRFIYFAFHNVRLGERVSTTALPSLGRRVLASIRLPLPNSDEQRAIATALSDADALIESLDRLIAKKRAIKQAAMQQLVTGETRLPGFDGDWQRVRLGELGRWRGGATPSMSVAEYWENGNTPWVSSSDIRQGEIESMSGRITDRAVRETAVTVVPKNSVIVVVRSGILRRYLPVVRSDGSVAINQDLMALEPGRRHDPRFLMQALLAFDERLRLNCVKSGTTVESVDAKWFRGFEIDLPELDEQRTIAAALEDMDAEIYALESRRHKARQVKQGMMQELLTGQIRLVEPNQEAVDEAPA